MGTSQNHSSEDEKRWYTDFMQKPFVKDTRLKVQEWKEKDGFPFYGSMLFFLVIFVYLEFITHLFLYRSISGKIIYPILLSIPWALGMTILSGLFQKKWNRVIMWILTGIVCLFFGTQMVYYRIFKVMFSFQTMGMADDAVTEFASDFVRAIYTNLVPLLLMFLPLGILWFFGRNSRLGEKRDWKKQGALVLATIVFHNFALVTLLAYGKSDYSPYDLYHNTKVPELTANQLGIVTLYKFDIMKVLGGEDDQINLAYTVLTDGAIETSGGSHSIISPVPSVATPKDESNLPTKSGNQPSKEVLGDNVPIVADPTSIPIDRSPNVLDIDFATLIKNESNKDIKTLHNYFSSQIPSNKNEYTGMFEGYNLIMITAEGFSPYAIHEEKTPTLYKMVREGFVFNNFYTPLWQTSTSDGEYVAMTGLIPVGTRSMYHTRKNLMPFSLGHQFNRLGIHSRAYHNHTYTYYQRDETHPNLGYDYMGLGNGLVLDSKVWPESDLEMVDHTTDLYVDESPFHVYYLTVSGHMNYTFVGNSMSYKNRHLVEDLPYDSSIQAYIACQLELDRALELLLQRLEEAGQLDNTVIALSADHYPYGWEKEHIDTLAGKVVDPNFEIYKNHFILWNSQIKEPIVIDKPCSSLDILPTLSNLFALPYDSRLLMGQDILSDGEPLVILNNRSFITDKVMYNAQNGKATWLTNETISEDYINNMNRIVKNKFTVSQSLVKMDYYRTLFPNYPEGYPNNNNE